MKYFAIMVLLTIFKVSIVTATPIITTWKIDGLSQFDWSSNSYETPTVPTNFNLTITFPSEVTNAIDYGQTTITDFGNYGDTDFNSPLDAYIGSDPFGYGLASQVAYTFPNVSDYSSTYFEEFATQSNAYSTSGDQFWSYHIETRVRRYTASQGGTGSSDYAFTTQTLLSFLDDVIVNPQNYQFIFSEYWEVFDRSTNVYLSGKAWDSYNENVRLTSITTVPEPSTFSLLSIGLLLLGFARPNRKVKLFAHDYDK